MQKDTNNTIAPDIIAAIKDHLPLHKSQAEFARVLGVSSTVLSRAIGGGAFKYNIPDFESKVRHYLSTLDKLRDTTEVILEEGFLVQPMSDFFVTVHATKDIGVAWCDAGYGKSMGIKVHQSKDPLCIVISARKTLCGYRAVRNAILDALPQKRRIGSSENHRDGTKRKAGELETWDAFLLRTFAGSGRLLIIDNAHLLTESARQWLAYDWHEVTGCPLALVGNPAIKDQWSRNDQHQSRVGLAEEVYPTATATETARAMLRLHLPIAEKDAQTVKLATAVVKSKGACRSLRKHALLAKELLNSGQYSQPADAFKAANKKLLSAPDLNLDAA